MSLPFLKLNEDAVDAEIARANIEIAQKMKEKASAMQKVADLDKEIADLKSKIGGTEQQEATSQEGEGDQTSQINQKLDAMADAIKATTGVTSESLIERVDPSMDEESRIQQEIDDTEDKILYYQEHYEGDPETKDEIIDGLITDISQLQDRLADLEKDQMEHEQDLEDNYWVDPAGGRHYDYGGDDDDFYDPASMYESEDEEELEEKSDGPCWKGYEMVGMKEKGGKKVPNCVPKNESVNEKYASPYRPNRELKWKGKTYYIGDVENVNDKMDIVHVAGKAMSSKHLEADGAEMVPKPPKPKKMTKREYQKTLKDAMTSLKADIGEYDHSIVYDIAENLYYDSMIKDYVVRRYQKDLRAEFPWRDPEMIKYEEPSKNDIIELITNDLEMSESYKPTAKKNFRRLEETRVEQTSKPDEDYVDEDYVFYVKVNDEGNEFIGKIFKVRPDGDWFGLVKKGKSDTFQKISYEPEYDEMDIVKFLGENYDEVEIIDRHEYNDFIEDDIDEDVIGGSSWPTNSVASPQPKPSY